MQLSLFVKTILQFGFKALILSSDGVLSDWQNKFFQEICHASGAIDTHLLRAYFFRIYIQKQRSKELHQLWYSYLTALFDPADIVLKLSLRFFKKRSINHFVYELKNWHALIGNPFSTDHIGGKN